MERIVIAAPQFVQAGGWVLDTQFVPNMFMAGRGNRLRRQVLRALQLRSPRRI